MPAPRRFRYTPRMPYSLAILDLDGTLADSFPWFLRHVNDVADRFGFRRIEEDEIEPLRRAGSREVLKRLEVPLWKLPLIARHMRRLKAAHIGDIPLFPEVEPMLRALHDSGMRLALVSSDNVRWRSLRPRLPTHTDGMKLRRCFAPAPWPQDRFHDLSKQWQVVRQHERQE